MDAVSTSYLKRLNILLYQLFLNYTPVLLITGTDSFSSLLRNLYLIVSYFTDRVQYTQNQYDFRCYFQLLLIWNELCELLSQCNWS